MMNNELRKKGVLDPETLSSFAQERMGPASVRVQFELSREQAKELASLMQQSGARTKRELFNNALSLFQWALKEVTTGRIIASVDETHGKYKQVLLPTLSRMR